MCRSKRKQMEEQMRQLAAQNEELVKRLAQSEQCKCHSHEDKKKVGRKAGWVLTTNGGAPVPAAPPSDFIQLTPIVQPVPLVPYSSQRQPMFIIEDEDDND